MGHTTHQLTNKVFVVQLHALSPKPLVVVLAYLVIIDQAATTKLVMSSLKTQSEVDMKLEMFPEIQLPSNPRTV